MDDRRFDQLTRMVGRGASRRSILKGLLGLGGAAVAGATASDAVDARQTGSRPTIPPPPPPPPTPTTPPPTTPTPEPRTATACGRDCRETPPHSCEGGGCPTRAPRPAPPIAP